jgi:hypothetical protein
MPKKAVSQALLKNMSFHILASSSQPIRLTKPIQKTRGADELLLPDGEKCQIALRLEPRDREEKRPSQKALRNRFGERVRTLSFERGQKGE